MDDTVEASVNRIRPFLHGQGIYDPDNLPTPEPTEIKGNYHVIGGAFRWIFQEDRVGRENEPEVETGDLVGLWFDARIFTGTFDNATTYFTNIPERINAIAGSNTEFDARLWPRVPLEVTIGAGERILLPAVENCLPGVRRGDEVRIFLTPDLWNGNRGLGNIPAWSTLVFQITVDSVVKN